MKKILVLFCAAAPLLSRGQTADAMEKLFPGKLAVFSNISRNLDISYRDGLPVAESNEVSDMMILNDRANGIYNKESIFHSGYHELKKIEAWSVLSDSRDSKKIKVSDFITQSSHSENVFYDDGEETDFSYPAMQRGGTAHVETEYFKKDIRFISPFYFSSYLPVYNATYSVSFPEDMDIRYIIRNDDAHHISVTESTKGKKKKLEFTASSIADYARFDNGAGIEYYAPHVIIYVAGYKDRENSVPVFKTVDDLYHWNAGFLKNVNTSVDPQVKQLADSICRNTHSEPEKAAAIYSWVQQHIKYLAFEQGLEGFIPRQAADVLSKRYGDCKDMASLLTGLLTAAGIHANFTWIGTRSIPYSYNDVPLPMSSNHMICTATINGEHVFLDATDPNCIYGFPTSMIQGKQALINIGDGKYEIAKVPVIAASENTIIDSAFFDIIGHSLKGSVKTAYSGYAGADMRTELIYNKGEDEKVFVRSKITRGSNKFLLGKYRISFPDDAKKTTVVIAEAEIPDYAQNAGNEIFVNLNPNKILGMPLIDSNLRRVAVENDYLYTESQSTVINIPAGFETDYVPKNISLSNELADLSITYIIQPGRVIATQRFVQKKLYIQPADFAAWNKIIAGATPAYKEQLVLRKK